MTLLGFQIGLKKTGQASLDHTLSVHRNPMGRARAIVAFERIDRELLWRQFPLRHVVQQCEQDMFAVRGDDKLLVFLTGYLNKQIGKLALGLGVQVQLRLLNADDAGCGSCGRPDANMVLRLRICLYTDPGYKTHPVRDFSPRIGP